MRVDSLVEAPGASCHPLDDCRGEAPREELGLGKYGVVTRTGDAAAHAFLSFEDGAMQCR
jgi:hypothetical protein